MDFRQIEVDFASGIIRMNVRSALPLSEMDHYLSRSFRLAENVENVSPSSEQSFGSGDIRAPIK